MITIVDCTAGHRMAKAFEAREDVEVVPHEWVEWTLPVDSILPRPNRHQRRAAVAQARRVGGVQRRMGRDDRATPPPRSEPGDTLHQDENGVVWTLRADGTPVVAMSERANERIIGGGNHALD